ncbi:uncharacterized protein LOC143462825 isoform X1 [Clavelina lepadiformis]|uniref:uncharacterized protein LOC143462825 isoform X1 n=1 Tax=Clavelina lepadiformis TaxID=159417 RepID=UPI0040428024
MALELENLKPSQKESHENEAFDNDESVQLSTYSGSVTEVSRTEQDKEMSLGILPGNPAQMHEETDSAKKTTTVLNDDELSTPTIMNLKNKNKSKSTESINKAFSKFSRNRVGPAEILSYEKDRPSSAPPNKARIMLQELNPQRPKTAAPNINMDRMKVAEGTGTDKENQETVSIKSAPEETVDDEKKSAAESDVADKPAVNETAYIPYEYARAMIARVVGDMNTMKVNHMSIISKMESEYNLIEEQTKHQFSDCVTQLQETYKSRLVNYRRIIELLQAELKAKGIQQDDIMEDLKRRNKKLLEQKQKLKKRSHEAESQYTEVTNKKTVVAAVPIATPTVEEDAQSDTPSTEAEEKIKEDSIETEKEVFGDVSAAAVVVAGKVVEEAEDDHDEEEETEEPTIEKEIKDDNTSSVYDEDEEAEMLEEDARVEQVSPQVEDKSEEEAEVVLEPKDEGQVEKEEETKNLPKVKEEHDIVVVPVPIPGKEKQASPAKSSLKKKPTKPEPKAAREVVHEAPATKGAIVSSLREKQLDKQVKKLEKQLDLESRKTENSRKLAKETDIELQQVKKEMTNLEKLLNSQQEEFAKLTEAAGAGTIALQKLPQLKEDIKTLTVQNQTLVDNYNTERVLRKKYYNMVEDMKGKIRVYCRVRPLSSTEKANKNKYAVQTPDDYTIKIEMNRGGLKEFQFDQIFAENSSQETVFEDTHSLIQSAVDGYNVCIFAYGQTGSGKTYTMIGDGSPKAPGIAPRAFNRIFEIVQKNQKKFTFTVSCYMLELYNEKLVDLLNVSKGNESKLDIKKDNKGMVVINGTEIVYTENADELYKTFSKGSENRHTSSTKMNDASSRSHLVVGVVIESTNLTTGAVTRGKLSLVDLAGSERVGKTGASAGQLKEANSINKSLSALGDVISALSSEQSFIPYRNNKLTLLMQDSLGGNAKTLMFVNVSPADYNSDESAISLTYASRVKLIKNDASKNAETKEVARLKQIIAKLKAGEAVDET